MNHRRRRLGRLLWLICSANQQTSHGPHLNGAGRAFPPLSFPGNCDTLTLAETPTTPEQTAEALASFGWRIVPIAPGMKHPAGLNNWQENATDDLATIRDWYSGPFQGYGLGVATGPGSGIWALDIDTHDGLDGYNELKQLTALNGPLPQTVQSATGGGGAHILFTWDPNRPITNGMANRLAGGLDIRGEGGQIVLPPTIHPSGRPYEWITNPFTTDIAEAPEWLYDLLLAPEPAPVVAPTTAAHPTAFTSQGETPAEWINNNHDWHTELSVDGWRIHSHKPDQTWWTRPGKNVRDGHSAVLHEPDGPLVVFTTSIPVELQGHGKPTSDNSGTSYSLFSYLAACRYGGDQSAAARDALQHMDTRLLPSVDINIGTQPQHDDRHPDYNEALIEIGEPSTWLPVDLETAINQPPPKPEYLTRPDGTSFLYPGRDHVFFGPSESGKSWAAFIAVHQTLERGGRVLVIDFEDDARSVTERLTALGAPQTTLTDTALFRYVNPHEPVTDRLGRTTPATQALDDLIGWEPELVVIDGVTEGMTLEGLGTTDAGDVAAWYALLSRRFRGTGACVVMIDHTAKALTDGAPTEFGSQHKRAGISGASYMIEPVARPGRAVGTEPVEGVLRLRLAKDRGGFLRGRFRGETPVVTDITITSFPDGGVSYHIDSPVDNENGGIDNLTAEIIATIWTMGREQGMTRTAVAEYVGRDRADKAVSRRLSDLSKDGSLTVKEVGRSKFHVLSVLGRSRFREVIDALENQN